MSEEESIASPMVEGAIAREVDDLGLDRGIRGGQEFVASENDGRAKMARLRFKEPQISINQGSYADLLHSLGFDDMALLVEKARSRLHAVSNGRGGEFTDRYFSKRTELEVDVQKNSRKRFLGRGREGGGY